MRPMSPEFEELQELLLAEARKAFGETAADHAFNPRNMGRLNDANGFARITGPCGDTMEIWVKIQNEMIATIGFLTDGCGTSIASGSMTTTLVKGKSISEAGQIDPQDVLEALGGLPKESEHCATLATNTLKAAIENYQGITGKPQE